MNILAVSGASYLPPRGGSTRSNRAWLEELAAQGHTCRILAPALDAGGVREELRRQGLPADGPDGAADAIVVLEGVTVRSVPATRLIAALEEEVASFAPDWILVSSEDAGARLLRAAARLDARRIVYLAHTPQMFPFGPASLNADGDGGARAALMRSAAIVAIGRSTAAYVHGCIGREPVVVHPPIYGPGPWPDYGARGPAAGAITLINGCQVKGLSIFIALAGTYPGRRFRVVTGWGTTAGDRRLLAACANVEVCGAFATADALLEDTSVLLVPSLWQEGFGLVVVEAMARGIPVVASDAGGLTEAKLGVPYVVPVTPIARYRDEVDDQGLPLPSVPAQDLTPWRHALDELMQGDERYRRVSRASRAAAQAFVDRVGDHTLEACLRSLGDEPLRPVRARPRPRRPLRLLAALNSPYFPAYGGANISNRLLFEDLTRRGHACTVVARLGALGPERGREYVEELRRFGVAAAEDAGGVVSYRLNGVEVAVETRRARLTDALTRAIGRARHDALLVSLDNDPSLHLVRAALSLPPSRSLVLCILRNTLCLPFGPDAAFVDAEAHALLRRLDGIATVSGYVRRYVETWGGLPAAAVAVSLHAPGPYPLLGDFARGAITMINPCAIKGLSIFTALARARPDLPFAAVPTWGTTEADGRELASLANVTLTPRVDDVDELYARTRVLLVPSLWAEARSRIAVEAMARGIPVLASDIGGIAEAMMGVDFLLPVTPITRYEPRVDDQMVPVADVPPQDIQPWLAVLDRVTTDRGCYDETSRAARTAATRAIAAMSSAPFEDWLYERLSARRDASAAAAADAIVPPAATASAASAASLQALSPERRRLLVALLDASAARRQGTSTHVPEQGTD